MRPALPTSILTLALTSCLLSPSLAQAPPPPPAEPAAPAPPAVRPPIAGRMLTLDECIAIALEAQPKITATLFDYAAARYRVNQAFAPLLPQLTGSVGATRSQSIFLFTSPTTGQTTQTLSSRQLSDTFLAQVQLSQLLFDFGKNLAFTESQRKLAEVAVEAIELQRQLIALAVKEAYTNSLLGQRLIKVNQQALERPMCRTFFPDISGTGTYGGSQPQLNENWSVGLSLSWTFFDGGGRIAKYQEAQANLSGAKARAKSAELDIIQNVEQSEIAVEESQERIQAAQALVASAQENFRPAHRPFDPGLGTR